MKAKMNFPLNLSISTGRERKEDLPVYPSEAQIFNVKLYVRCGLTLAGSEVLHSHSLTFHQWDGGKKSEGQKLENSWVEIKSLIKESFFSELREPPKSRYLSQLRMDL